jgi:hypothetical protein
MPFLPPLPLHLSHFPLRAPDSCVEYGGIWGASARSPSSILYESAWRILAHLGSHMTSAFYFSRLFISHKSCFLNKKRLFCIPDHNNTMYCKILRNAQRPETTLVCHGPCMAFRIILYYLTIRSRTSCLTSDFQCESPEVEHDTYVAS